MYAKSREERLAELERERKLYSHHSSKSRSHSPSRNQHTDYESGYDSVGRTYYPPSSNHGIPRPPPMTDYRPPIYPGYDNHIHYPSQQPGHGSVAETDDIGTSSSDVGTDDVCFARDVALKGKIKLSKDGKHSFVDLESSHPSHNPSQTEAVLGYTPSMPGSLSKSLQDLSKAEKARIKAEKAVKVAQEHAAAALSVANASSPRRSPSPARKIAHEKKTDVFQRLVSKEQKSRAKYHVSEKALLEEERIRYAQLEDAYHKLLLQVQQLQQSHLQDLRTTESRFHASSSTLQKALVLKSEESATLSSKLVQLESKYERDRSDWGKDRAGLVAKVDELGRGFDILSKKYEDREKKMGDLNRLRKELADRLAQRENELIKYGKALREKEGDFLREKESRMKYEVKAMKLEEDSTQRENELKSLRDDLARKQTELEEFYKVKSGLSETKRDLEDIQRREKNYLLEIEQSAQRERKLFSEVEELASQQRKYVSEVSRLTARTSSMTQDIDMYKTVEQKLREELQDSIVKNSQQGEQIVDLERQLRSFQNDSTRLLQNVSELETTLNDIRKDKQSLEQQVTHLSNSLDQVLNEKESLLRLKNQYEQDLDQRDREISDLNNQVNDMTTRLEAELHAKIDMKQQNKEKLLSVSQRLSDLQTTLSETQLQLQDLRENESMLRNQLRQREETLRGQNQTISELQERCSELQIQAAKDAQEFDAFKSKKRDEILGIQEKFNNAKTAMEQEVTSLRSQLQQKLSHIANLTEEISRIKVGLSEAGADRFSLEARISELQAGEASYQRQVASLQLNLNQKTQELNRLTSKQSVLLDQLKRLEEENAAYRGGQAQVRDNEISKLQSNMDEISKRLKSQVDLLLDRDGNTIDTRDRVTSPSVGGGDRSPSRTGAPYDLGITVSRSASPTLDRATSSYALSPTSKPSVRYQTTSSGFSPNPGYQQQYIPRSTLERDTSKRVLLGLEEYDHDHASQAPGTGLTISTGGMKSPVSQKP